MDQTQLRDCAALPVFSYSIGVFVSFNFTAIVVLLRRTSVISCQSLMFPYLLVFNLFYISCFIWGAVALFGDFDVCRIEELEKIDLWNWGLAVWIFQCFTLVIAAAWLNHKYQTQFRIQNHIAIRNENIRGEDVENPINH